MNWTSRQDSFLEYFRSDRDEHRAKESENVAMSPEEIQRRENAALAARTAKEKEIQDDLRKSLLQPRE